MIEHSFDVIKTADWIVDLGLEDSVMSGEIVAVGTPEDMAAEPSSHTGRYLALLLEWGREAAE